MTTAADIIKGAARLIGILGNDVVLTARETTYPFNSLCYLLDSWSNDSGAIYTITKESFALTANHNPHTFGATGDFNSVRPIRILAAKITVAGVDQDVPIMSYDDYAEVSQKAATAADPQYLYCDYAFPLANVYLSPVATSTDSILLFCEKPLTLPTALSSTLSFPPGFLRALMFNLAVEIAPQYQVQPSPDVQRIAVESYNRLQRQTRRVTTSQTAQMSLPPNQA